MKRIHIVSISSLSGIRIAIVNYALLAETLNPDNVLALCKKENPEMPNPVVKEYFVLSDSMIRDAFKELEQNVGSE